MMRRLSLLLVLLCFNANAFLQKKQYPGEWWDDFPKDQAKSWEILPQEAKPAIGSDPTEVILSKRNELGILSNFAHTPFTYKGVKYESLEGFWQMMKYPEDNSDPRMNATGVTWKHKRSEVAQMIGFDAKDAGKLASQNMKIMGINWVSFEGKKITYKTTKRGDHFEIIKEATLEKVMQNPKVKRILLATGNLMLRPDHSQDPDTPPAWKYYEILMDIRTQLQKLNP